MTGTLPIRRSIRLPEYDYAAAGAYSVTICVQGGACVLGEIDGDATALSEVGQVVESWWGSISRRFPTVALDAYVVMPNHVHGILRFGWDEAAIRRGGPPCPPVSSGRRAEVEADGTAVDGVSTAGRVGAGTGGHGGPPLREVGGGAPTLGKVMQWFKSATTRDYGVGVETSGWTPYPGRLWQRSYYEHVVRDEADLERIRAYIAGNPARWAMAEGHRETCHGFLRSPAPRVPAVGANLRVRPSRWERVGDVETLSGRDRSV
ncbi:MAG: transposase [Thermomicrobiales bacterium]